MEEIESSEDITDLSELVCDTRKLRTHTERSHESNSEDRDSSWRKTPEIRREQSNEEKDENFKLWRHLYIF